MSETSSEQMKSVVIEDRLAVIERLLREPLPGEAVKQRSEQGKTLSYIEGWYAIDRANEIFGYGGWSSEIVAGPSVVADFERERSGGGKNRVVVVQATLRVKALGTFHDGIGVGLGHAGIDNASSAFELAIKAACTDGIKRALIHYGPQFGLHLYDKDAPVPSSSGASSNGGGAAAAGGGFAPPAPQIPDLATDPIGHWAARLRTARSQAEYGQMFDAEGGPRKSLTGEQVNAVWHATEPHYNGLPKEAPAVAPPAERPRTSSFTFKFGRDKGIPVADLSDESLKFYASAFERDLGDASKSEWHGSTRKNLDAVRAEQAWRKAHGQGPAQQAA